MRAKLVWGPNVPRSPCVPQNHQRVKVIAIGNSSVGKSSLAHRFKSGSHYENIPPTIGVDVINRTVRTPAGLEARIELHDTAGQERFFSMTTQYYRNTDVILFVYDATQKASFDRIFEYWNKEVDKCCNTKPLKLLISTKNDLEDQITVDCQLAREMSVSYGMTFLPVSAVSGQGMDDIFNLITGVVVRNRTENTVRPEKRNTGGSNNSCPC